MWSALHRTEAEDRKVSLDQRAFNRGVDRVLRPRPARLSGYAAILTAWTAGLMAAMGGLLWG